MGGVRDRARRPRGRARGRVLLRHGGVRRRCCGQLPTGAHLVIPDDCYQARRRHRRGGRARPRLARRAVRAGRHRPRGSRSALEADLLWLESPTNPLLEIADVAAICAAPRKPGTRVVVDNTFATPLLQQPLALGADLVIHAATKFIGGHSDLLIGRRDHRRRRRSTSCCAPRARSTAPRRARSSASSPCAACARCRCGSRRRSPARRCWRERLEAHPAVHRVRYPGFGAVVSFELADADDGRPRLPRDARSSGTPRAWAASRRRWSGAASIPGRSTSRTG